MQMKQTELAHPTRGLLLATCPLVGLYKVRLKEKVSRGRDLHRKALLVKPG